MNHCCDRYCTHETESFYAGANRTMDGVGMLLCALGILFLAWMTFWFGVATLDPTPGVNPLGTLLGFALFGCWFFFAGRGFLRRV